MPPPLPANNNSKMPRLRPKFAANRAHDLSQAPFDWHITTSAGASHIYTECTNAHCRLFNNIPQERLLPHLPHLGLAGTRKPSAPNEAGRRAGRRHGIDAGETPSGRDGS